MPEKSRISDNGRNVCSAISLKLEIREPLLVGYFEPFEELERSAKALEALKVGVIALQTACPTLDTQIVKDQFAEIQRDFGKALADYFGEKNGLVPKTLNDALGEKGALAQFFQRHFDPESGRLVRIMQGQIGPTSAFGRLFDPKNRDGLIATMEEKVKNLVEIKLNEVLDEFSLDEDGSAMGRLKAMIDKAFGDLREALGVKAAREVEAERGHCKGFDFEADLYAALAEMGRRVGDETECVRGVHGSLKRKTGDHIIVLGDTSGSPGLRIVVEAKEQKYKAKQAIDELKEAKKNRQAVSGIFVFAKGCEPVEFGDFKRIENDFYCTVEKEALADGGPLVFFWGAYEIARALAVAASRKETNGTLDLDRVRQHLDAISACLPRLGDIVTKTNTIESSACKVREMATSIKQDLKSRIDEILHMLELNPEKPT
jgi:hypothetical protein